MSRIGHEEPMVEFARFPMDASFQVFRRFNREDTAKFAGVRGRFDRRALEFFEGDGFPEKIARAIIHREAIVAKELFESFEFFQRVRRSVRRKILIDVSAGHGLTGLVFAAMEREVEQVYLVDPHRPKSSHNLAEAIFECAPWARDKVTWVEKKIQRVREDIPGDASPEDDDIGIIGVHACGILTDHAIDLALDLRAPIAVLPCCYAQTALSAPPAVRDWLGAEITTDIHRTYRMENAGYDVIWSAIPRVITPKNRIMIGRPRAGSGAGPSI